MWVGGGGGCINVCVCGVHNCMCVWCAYMSLCVGEWISVNHVVVCVTVTVYGCNPVHVPGLLRLSRVDVSHTRVDVSHTRVMFHTFVRFECCALYL